MAHPLLDLFTEAATGRFPPVDGGVTYLPELDDGNRAVVAFTGHAVIASPFTPLDLADLELDGFGAALAPKALLRIAGDGAIGVNDVVLVASGLGSGPPVPETTEFDLHPRVQHARHLRRHVSVHGDRHGFFTLADGLAGRREISIELAAPGKRTGTGRELLHRALGMAPVGDPVFAAVAPGNARSLRAFLASGFTPIGSEVIIDVSATPDVN